MSVIFSADPGAVEISSDELTRNNVESMRRVEAQAMARRSGADRIAAFVATFCCSMPFVWLHVLIFLAAGWPGIRGRDSGISIPTPTLF